MEEAGILFIRAPSQQAHGASLRGHVGDKGCAVLEAVEKGELLSERYQNYLKMTKESTFNDMSYLEKREKDKQFGKHIKAVMKYKKSQK